MDSTSPAPSTNAAPTSTSSTAAYRAPIPNTDTNGYSTSPLTLDQFMWFTGPDRLSEEPTNTEIFSKLQEYGRNIHRLKTAAEREVARNWWGQYLKRSGVDFPWRVLDAAATEGNMSVGVPTKGLTLTDRHPVLIEELDADSSLEGEVPWV